MNISRRQLGIKDDSCIYQYTLDNDHGMKLQILTLGASIQTIELPFSDGSLKNVALSYANWETYLDNPLYLGATLAPNAGRISEATLPVGNDTYTLTRNEGRHNAHGGYLNASHQNWAEVTTACSLDCCSVTLSIRLPDGLDGFPGDRFIHVCYKLDNDNTINIQYYAQTNKPTYLNLSNHTYFNLSGDFTQSGLHQLAEINANTYVSNNSEHIPEGIYHCTNSPFDFNVFTSFSEHMAKHQNQQQLTNANGYNNAFLLNHQPNQLTKALCLIAPSSEHIMELYTDAPSIVIYSGGYIGNHWSLADGYVSSNSCAIAIEAQDIPDTPNFMREQCIYTTPDQPFERTIIYKFILHTL